MTTLAIFLVICGFAVAMWGLLYVATGQHHIRRRLRANQRERDRQMREFAHKETVAPLERELGIKDSVTGKLLHPKPRKRLAYHPVTGELVEPWSITADRIYPPQPEPRKSGLIRLPSTSVVHKVMALRKAGYALVLRMEHGENCVNGRAVSRYSEIVLDVFESSNGPLVDWIRMGGLTEDEYTVISGLSRRPEGSS